MIKKIIQFIPKYLRDFLRPIIYWLFHIKPKHTFVRDWNIKVDGIPEDQNNLFIESILTGELNFQAKNEHINLLLCAQPKSASLYMVQLLSSCLGFKNHQIGFNLSGGSVYYPRLLAAKFSGNTISHCHAEPDPHTLKIVTNLNLKPIVLTRNLLDSLVSRKDMLVRDQWVSNMLSPLAMNDFINAPHEKQMDIIIDLFASAYINFFVGWEQHRHNSAIKPIYISYEELIENEANLVKKVAEELGLAIEEDTITQFSNEISTLGGINFSTGISGRGKDLFTKEQIETLKKKALLLGCDDESFLGFNCKMNSINN